MDMIDLIRRAQTGDTEAQGELYEQTYKRVYYLALRLTKNPEDAQDAVQEAYISAFKALPNLKDPNAFQGWLFQIVANKCKNTLRKGAHETEMPETEDGRDFCDDIPDENEGILPESVLESAEKRRLILQIIDDLPAPQRECVMLFYFSGLSVAQIAQTLDCSEGTIKSRLNYARQKIRDGVLLVEERDDIRLHVFIPIGLLFAQDFELTAASITAAALGGAGAAGAAGAASTTAGTTTAGTVKAGLLATAKAKVIAGVTAAAITIGGGAAIVSQMPKAITFSDPAMEQNIRVLVDKPSGSIYDRDFKGHHAITVYEDGIAFTGEDEAQNVAAPGTVPVTSLADMAQMPSITSLDYVSMEEEPLHTLGQNSYLTSVYISTSGEAGQTPLFVEDTSFLKELPNLERLHLNVNAGSGGDSIGHCTNLRGLSLFVSERVRLNLRGLKKLESLCIFGSEGSVSLRGDEELPALRIIDWFNTSGDLADLLPLAPQLAVANLYTDNNTEEVLEALGQLPALRAVKLTSGADEDMDLAPLSACSKLELCTIYDTQEYRNPPAGVQLDIIQRTAESELFGEIHDSVFDEMW